MPGVLAFHTILCFWLGEGEKGISGMFELGAEGLSVGLILQLLAISAIISLLRILFLTNCIIRTMSLVSRTVLMVLSTLVVVVFFIIRFHWFPANHWEPWALFLLCFLVSLGVSAIVTGFRERAANKKMEEALERFRKER